MKHCLRLCISLLLLTTALAWTLAPAAKQMEQAEREEVPSVQKSCDGARALRVLVGGELCEMDMKSYLTGVLRAEMPASFELEALKAQAVAARTYTLYKMRQGSIAAHPEADACDDITCCKAYMSASDAAKGWGSMALYYEQKLARAVDETDGKVILYDDSPVLAVFFSSSAGQTQGAEEVWLSGLPYLKSVSSPETEELVPNYYSTVRFKSADFCARICYAYPQAKFSGGAQGYITDIERNESGFVSTARVGGLTLRGNELRTVLDLSWPAFRVSIEGDELVFHVTGYGHGVGMSQYGANILAAGGATYEEILTHYYSDTTVGIWEK